MVKRVLVGCPTWDRKRYVLADYAQAVRALDYDSFDVLLVDTSQDGKYADEVRAAGLPCERIDWMPDARDRVITARNVLRKRALEGGYDLLFSLEQDVLPEPQTLKALIAHNKEFVTTLVMNSTIVDGKQHFVPMVSVPFVGKPGVLRYVQPGDLAAAKNGLLEISQSHLACTLIARNILERFAFRHDSDAFDDTCFCEDLLAAGITPWCDVVLRPTHRPRDWR